MRRTRKANAGHLTTKTSEIASTAPGCACSSTNPGGVPLTNGYVTSPLQADSDVPFTRRRPVPAYARRSRSTLPC